MAIKTISDALFGAMPAGDKVEIVFGSRDDALKSSFDGGKIGQMASTLLQMARIARPGPPAPGEARGGPAELVAPLQPSAVSITVSEPAGTLALVFWFGDAQIAIEIERPAALGQALQKFSRPSKPASRH